MKNNQPANGQLKEPGIVRWGIMIFVLVIFIILVRTTFFEPQAEDANNRQLQELVQSTKSLSDRIDKILDTLEAQYVR